MSLVTTDLVEIASGLWEKRPDCPSGGDAMCVMVTPSLSVGMVSGVVGWGCWKKLGSVSDNREVVEEGKDEGVVAEWERSFSTSLSTSISTTCVLKVSMSF